MNILITGGYGFLGSEIAYFLKKKKFNIIILDKKKIIKKNYY